MLLRFIETLAKRFLSDFLEVAVDGCVNTKPFVHRAVPTDGTDDLLPDIIDGVVLALRVLTISDCEFLRLRRRKIRVVNVTEVAHASEHIITRFTRSSLVRPRRQPVRTFDANQRFTIR